jgi:hypothetical protein
MIEQLLRWTAITIAVAAIVDPAVTVAGHVRPRLAIAVEGGSSSLDLPYAAGRLTRRDVARGVVQQLTRDLAAEFELVDGADPSATATVIVGDRYPVDIGSSAAVSTVSLSTPATLITPNVRVLNVHAPAAVPPATAIRIEATIEGAGEKGATTTVVVQTGGFEVGRATHTWQSDRETWSAGIDVVPVGAAPFTFLIAVEPLPNERTPIDNAATVRVPVAAAMHVLVFEARPSWAAAFVRRALEGDPRFTVSELGRMSPTAVVVSGEDRSLSDTALDASDVLIVGGLDALTQDELARIDRFLRARGGALVLLPDASAGIAPLRARFALPKMKELLLERHAALATQAPLPRIDASELSAADAMPADAEIVARMTGSGEPIVWTAPRGAGRLMFSGAMDAWRFRAEPQVEFDRFWRSAIAGLALAARRPISITVTPGQMFVELRDRFPNAAKVSGSARLFPDSGLGEFSGRLDTTTGASRDKEVVVSVSNSGTTREQRAPAEPLVSGLLVDPPGPPLALLSATHAGIDVAPERLAVLERFLRSIVAGPPAPIERRPMRSIWWMLPFAACLSAEWWLRRRRGLR